MNDGDTIRARQRIDGTLERVLPDGSTLPLTGDSDWPRLLAMSDDEIAANAAADPDTPPLSPDELARMRPVSSEPREIRQRLRLTQEEFAVRFGVPLALLRDWERGARQPDGAARTLLRVIDRNPEAVVQALVRWCGCHRDRPPRPLLPRRGRPPALPSEAAQEPLLHLQPGLPPSWRRRRHGGHAPSARY